MREKIIKKLKALGKPGLVLLFIVSSDVGAVTLAATKLPRLEKIWITMLGTSLGMCIASVILAIGIKVINVTTVLESPFTAFLIGLMPIPQIFGGSLPRVAALAVIMTMPLPNLLIHAFALLIGSWVRILTIVFSIEEIKVGILWLINKIKK